jgi:hypothetical protein
MLGDTMKKSSSATPAPPTSHPLVPTSKTVRVNEARLVAIDLGLTQRQIAFSENYVKLGGRHGCGAPAARAAGYKHEEVAVTRLLKHEGVLAYIKHLSQQKLVAGAALGASVLTHIAEHGTPNDAVKLKAATALLAHGGLGPVQQTQSINHTVVEHRADPDQLAAVLAKFRAALGYHVDDNNVIDITPGEAPLQPPTPIEETAK